MFAKFSRGILQVAGLLTILALLVAIGTFMFLAPLLQYQDQPERADYIVPLAGDGERLIKAAELYKQGLAPKILLSNEQIRPLSRSQEIAAKIGYPPTDPLKYRLQLLQYFEVPDRDIESFGDGLISTLEEAEALKQFLGSPRGTIILVTSPYQARRAKIIFERMMPNVHWIILWPPEERLSDRWWSNQDSALRAVSEVAKLLYYLAGGAFRRTAQLQD
jgi:uncharacterized SAM-binding protein YcdF (DUF218 family)